MLRITAAACARSPTTVFFLIRQSPARATQFRTYLSGPASDLSDAPPTTKTVASDDQKQKKRQRTPEEVAEKAALEKQDDLRRDWDAKILSYDEFLPRTQNPSPVRGFSRYSSLFYELYCLIRTLISSMCVKKRKPCREWSQARSTFPFPFFPVLYISREIVSLKNSGLRNPWLNKRWFSIVGVV